MTKRYKKLFHNKKVYIAKAIALAIFPLILLILPAKFFDKGPDACLFTILSGYHCPGCGMTRGCMHLIHLDYLAAWNYNKMCYVVLPIMCYLLTIEFMKTILKIRRFDMPETSSSTSEPTV